MIDSKLETEKDTAGVDVEIYYCPKIGNTPCAPFFLSNLVSMMEQGHVINHMVGNNRCRAIYAKALSKIVGQITFDTLDDYSKTTWIHSAAVLKDYRQRGIYKMMHRQLEYLMPQLGSRKVAAHVHITNGVGMAGVQRVGLEPAYIRVEKTI